MITSNLPWNLPALDSKNEAARKNEQRRLAARLKREKMSKDTPDVVGSGQGGTSITARRLRADGGLTWR